MEQFTEQLVKEWSWRLDDGMPDIEDPEKLAVLRQTLVEEYGVPKSVAEEQVQTLIAEASFPSKTDFEDDLEDALE